MVEDSKKNVFIIDHPDIVQTVEFSPYESSSQLLAIGSSNRVTIGSFAFQEEDKENVIKFDMIREFHNSTKVSAISWSRMTSLFVVPKCLRFCTAGLDKKIRCYNSDLKNDDSLKVIEGHTDYINDVVFDPEKGDTIVSVSDDHTCRIWDMDGNQQALFPLGSAGMRVCWHQEDPSKLLVAERKGVIRFYNLQTLRPIMSLDCRQGPLLSADWSHSNILCVGAVANSEFLVFDTSISSQPADKKQVHPDGAQKMRWSKHNPNLIATLGRPGPTFKVISIELNQTPVILSEPILNGISWHSSLPIIAVGGDKKVYVYAVETY